MNDSIKLYFGVSVSNIFRLITVSMIFSFSSGFVLLSGPAESRLGLTPESPTVKFIWDGKAPELDKKEEYEGGIYADKSDTEIMEELLNRALAIWSKIPGSFVKLEMTQDSGAVLNGEDNIHSIVVASSNNLTQAAFASPDISDDGKTIRDCDISVSTTKTSVKELLYTITHELGHCLGLGHNHTNYSAIMGYSRDVHSPDLGADDMAGIIYLYPDPNYSSGTPEENLGCGTIRQSQNSARNLGPVALLLPILVIPIATLRRRPAPRA